MTTPVLAAPTADDRIATPPLRLLLAPVNTAPTLLDGAWWPHSRDLTAELPALIAALDRLWGRVTRVTVNPTRWPVVPRKVPVAGHVVHVGWFKAQDPHKLLLLGYHTGRWDLLIIPPETTPARAAWLMTQAADPLRTNTATELMNQAAFRGPWVEGDQAQEAVWDTEGGQAPRAGRALPASRATALRSRR